MPDLFAKFITARARRANEKARLSAPALLLLALFALAGFAPGIASLPPTDRDESWFAQASKQMVESGNYVDIRVQDKPRYKKPVGIYWLQAASVKLFSPHRLDEIWAYRLPSLASAVLAVLLAATLGTFLFTPLAGCVAAIMLASSIALNVEARLAKTDAALLACVLAAQLALAKAWMGAQADNKPPPSARTVKSAWNARSARNAWNAWSDAILFWTALGIGLLIKGPVIALVIGLTIFGLYVSEPGKRKNLRWLSPLHPLPGLLWASLIVAPWLVAISLQSNGAFLEQAASRDFLAKLWQGQERGLMPPGLHLAVFPLMFFPFSLFAALAAPHVWRRREDPRLRFCLSWILPVWIVFELSMTKLPHYLLPTYPAIAILTAAAVTETPSAVATAAPSKTLTLLFALATGLWLTCGAGIALLAGWLPFALNGAPNLWQGLAGAALILAQGACLFLFLQKRPVASAISLAAGQMVFLATLAAVTAPSLRHIWHARDIVRTARTMQTAQTAKPCAGLHLISAAYNEPSLVFLAGTQTQITPDGSRAASLLEQNPCALAVIDQDHREGFASAFAPLHRQPVLKATFEGRNPANGDHKILSLYAMPPETAPLK